MTRAYTGGCACGAIRYESAAEPIMTNDCQCRQCQKDSGTGHASYLVFPRAAVEVHGEAKSFDFTGDLGTVKSRAFCPTCGTPVYMLFPQMPDIFVARAGTLDEPERYRPQAVLWTDAAQDWDRIDPSLKTFARMPPPAG
ncbi:GFA family protein [Pseudaminobacter sp. 19-2017]|uniref:GFA family protein n=1 Tax=Pseudaminobacter soli (ex Zhang et al. 2022) TaxID=2831468 RepID=A0A942E202_9HYPH|nr:GFA family protein [Pseudaminobacter soli]MBS3649556.1 GFA family protein [Pseudaminobacter soli]